MSYVYQLQQRASGELVIFLAYIFQSLVTSKSVGYTDLYHLHSLELLRKCRVAGSTVDSMIRTHIRTRAPGSWVGVRLWALLVFSMCWWNLGVSITQRMLPVVAPGRRFGLGRLDSLKF